MTRKEILTTDDIAADEIADIWDWTSSFDDLNDHIDDLKNELTDAVGTEHGDEIEDRIYVLQKCLKNGHCWIDNDATSSPDAWRNLPTFTHAEALKKYKEWTRE